MESSYRYHEKKMKVMCKHCKSAAHTTLQHGKHYKGFKGQMAHKRMAVHMKPFTVASDNADDKKHGVKLGSARDRKLDVSRGLPPHKKAMGVEAGAGYDLKKKKALPKTYDGKSTKLGHGGRAAKLRDEGVPGGVIGAIARSKGAAPGGPNYHGKKK